MRKVTCDRCGEDITYKSLVVIKSEHPSRLFGDQERIEKELCEECFKILLNIFFGKDNPE